MNQKKQKIIAVLGMHRSGTSAITRGLKVLGVDLGDRIAPGIPGNNAKGFWEDLDLNALNIEILNSIGRDWHSNPSITPSELTAENLWSLRLRAVELLREKMRGVPVWGLKDPRISRLLPFWNRVFDHLGLDVGYIIAVRHPMSVARSLNQRDGFEAGKSHYLWLEHMVPSVLESGERPRIVVDYDLMMEQPEAQLLRIADRLGLPSTLNASELEEYRENFLDTALQHTRFQPEDLHLDPTVPKGVIEAYGILRRLARDELPIDSPAVQTLFVQLAGHLDDIAPAKRYMMILEGHVSSLKDDATEYEAQIAGLNRTVAERDGQIVTLNSAASERDEQIAGLNHAAAELGTALSAQINISQSLQQSVAEQQNQIHQILGSRSWRATRVLRLVGRILRGEWKTVGLSFKRFADAFIPTQQSRQQAKSTADISGVAVSYLSSMPITAQAKETPRKRILLVSHYCPTRAHGGGLRILDIYSLIKSRYPDVQLDIYTHRRPGIDWTAEDVERIFDKVYYSPSEELTPNGLLALQERPPRYDVVDLQFHQSAFQLEGFRQLGKKIIFTPMESQSKALYIDLKSLFTEGRKFSLRRVARNIKLAAEEVIFSFKADEVVCVSRTDAAFLRTITGLKKVQFLETGISGLEFSDALADGWQTADPGAKENRIIYLAYFGSETNILALRWYLDHVHPRIKAQVPGYVLSVVGRGDLTPFSRYRDASVEFVGEVPSLAPQIAKARIGIAPALGGSGFRGKVNQYAIYGVPCVVSPIAAQGLAYRSPFNIFVAATSEEFAQDCIALLSDTALNRTMGQRARETCLAKYTWESKLKTIRGIYDLGNSA